MERSAARLSLDCKRLLARAARPLVRLHASERGATTLEWALLLAAIALPSYLIIRLAIRLLVEHYKMMTLINSLPFP